MVRRFVPRALRAGYAFLKAGNTSLHLLCGEYHVSPVFSSNITTSEAFFDPRSRQGLPVLSFRVPYSFFPLSLLSQAIHFYFSFHCGNFPFVVNEFKVHCPTFLSIGKKILFILLIRISPESRTAPGPRQAQ